MRAVNNLMVVISATNHYKERAKEIIELNEKEFDVLYVTSDFDHMRKEKYTCTVNNSIQLKVLPYYRNLSISRILSHCQFSLKVLGLLLKRRPARVYAEIPNNTLAFVSSIYKRLTKCYLEFDIFDMWPEALPIKSKNLVFTIACNIWRWFRNAFLKSADKVYVECEYYKQILVRQGCKSSLEVRYLKKTGAVLPYRNDFSMGQLNICYVGSINNIIDISLMTQVMVEMSKHKTVIFHAVGAGEGVQKLLTSLKGHNNIIIREYGVVYEENKLQDIFNQCILGLNCLLPDLAIGITMKSVTYLQGGVPLLNTVDGDTREFVNKDKIGINIDREDIQSTILKILSLSREEILEMKGNARRVFLQYFYREE